MSFLEGIVEKVATAVGMDPKDAEQLGDLVSLGVNIAVGNVPGAVADGIDLAGMDDELPWLEKGLDIAGGDPTSAAIGLDASSLGQMSIPV